MQLIIEPLFDKIVDVLHLETVERKELGDMEFTLYEWLHQSPRNVIHEDYYGNMLNGPNCEKVLRPETLRAMFEYVPEDLHKYVYALK